MKKLTLLAALTFILGQTEIQAKASSQQAKPIVTTTVSGYANVCPNDANVQYWGTTNFSGPTYWVEFKCGGLGVIAESGSQSYTIYGTGNNNSCHVNWGNYNGQTSWVQAVYHWSVLGINYTSTGTEYVNIGIIGDPNSISGVSSICANDISNYTFTCNNGLPYGAVGYQWSVTNGTIVSGGTSNTITAHATNSSNMVISVKFISGCGGYSNTYSYTVTKLPTLPLGAGYILSHLESLGLSNNLLVDLTFPAKPYSYNFHYIVTDPSSSPQNFYGTVAANTTGYAQASLAALGSTLYVNAYYTNESCGNYWNYARVKGGLSVGSHNRMANLQEEYTGTDNEFSSLSVFPVPTKDLINIDLNSNSVNEAKLTITDILGKVVISETKSIVVGQNEMSISVSELPAGIYMLTVSSNEKSEMKKIVVEK